MKNECIGGPLDGAEVPWVDESVAVYCVGSTVLAQYDRQSDGRYLFVALRREEDLEKAE